MGLAIAAVLALGIGGALGLVGGGGSILLVPVLAYVVGMSAAQATGTSLVVVLATSLAALVPHARAGHVRWGLGARFGALSVVTAWLGARISLLLPGHVVMVLLGVVMALTAVAMLRPRRAEPVAVSADTGSESRTPGRHGLVRLVPVALVVGALAGLLGAGGGFLAVPALVLALHLPFQHAVGTSLLVISVGAVAGLVGRVGGEPVDVVTTVVLAGASVAGSLAGSLVARRVSAERLRAGLGWLIAAVAIAILAKEVPPLVAMPGGG